MILRPSQLNGDIRDVAKVLIKNGAVVNAVQKDNCTALHFAARHKRDVAGVDSERCRCECC